METGTQTAATTGNEQTSGVSGGLAAPQDSPKANISIGEGQKKYIPAPSDTETDDQTGGETGTRQAGEIGIAGQQTAGTETKQTPDQNRAFAQMRRELEAAQKALKDRDEWVASQFGETHGIRTWDQYQTAVTAERQQAQATQQQQMDRYRREQEAKLREAGYNVEEIREAMRTDPIFVSMVSENQQLKNELSGLKTERQREQQERMQQQIVNRIVSDHEKLRKKYGDLVPGSLDDLDTETVNLMREGVPLGAAWREANEDKILEWAKTGATAKALKNAGSKDHLGMSEKSTGTEAHEAKVEMTPEQWRVWRQMYPKETDAQIRKRAEKFIVKRK